ncbi:vitamin K epoxide reductase family protein [Candidatus Rhabdochlamydia porcellionis]|jgi:hypothetical protein|uniref:Vitamin K epoxide reductase family n=1 Tax=Candidatus Rhabdochlamydia porcellionis TaxID=225148 RepID=A0ABX8Z4K0_9BACT|nr:vitamin K epoxide reductase family protein [Candidatus Rhabdochlamydia porcellionis]QZA59021.1 Vitamin K epoxide reductase family [Candidatus Rhabdochlamydia porcellionis]
MKKLFCFLSMALGIWLFANPLTFSYQDDLLMYNDLSIGLLITLFAIGFFYTKKKGFAWGITGLGIWLKLAPLAFWASQSLIYLNDTLIGSLAVVFGFQLAMSEISFENTNFYPKGWSFNPSSWTARVLTIALALVCWLFSRYMAAYQLGYIAYVWDPFFLDGTSKVLNSDVSHAFPISDAGLGAFGYTLEFLLGWQGGSKRWAKNPWLVCFFGFLVVPVSIISVLLIILQPVVVGAWCSLCLATACFMSIMILFTAPELVATLLLLKEAKHKHCFWQTFWHGIHIEEKKPKFFKQSFGITLPWNLLLLIIVGVWLIISSYYISNGFLINIHYILGPLIAFISLISCAEVFRSLRFLNLLFGAILLVVVWFHHEISLLLIFHNLFLGALICFLSFPKGKVLEKYGSWQRLIF